jgi:hypothetical protein
MANEVDDVISMTASVPGVEGVLNELDPHESAEGIPSLQGEGHTAGY